jgi:hypothetical protein
VAADCTWAVSAIKGPYAGHPPTHPAAHRAGASDMMVGGCKFAGASKFLEKVYFATFIYRCS